MTRHNPDTRQADALTAEDLASERAVDLPEREAMSTIGHGFGHFDHIVESPLTPVDEHIGNTAVPINEASAENNYSTSSIAAADAEQVVILNQDTTVGS